MVEVSQNLALFLPTNLKLSYLYTMIISIGDNNILFHAQTETMGRVKLALARPQLTKLAPNLHWTNFISAIGYRIWISWSCAKLSDKIQI